MVDPMSEGKPVEAKRRLEELQADADHSRRKYDLYRAKVYGPRPTSHGRLRELERTSALAQSRLERAKAAA